MHKQPPDRKDNILVRVMLYTFIVEDVCIISYMFRNLFCSSSNLHCNAM